MCYLLFAGSQPAPHGGLGDLVGTFTSEATARQAFRDLRLSQVSASSWGQLAVVDAHHGLRPLAWFGIAATPATTPRTLRRPASFIHTAPGAGVMQAATLPSPSSAGPKAEPMGRRRPLRRMAVCLVGPVALGAITLGVVSDRSARPVTPMRATVDGGGPANAVTPSSVDGPVISDATGGFQR